MNNSSTITKNIPLERHTTVWIVIFLPCYSLFDLSLMLKRSKVTAILWPQEDGKLYSSCTFGTRIGFYSIVTVQNTLLVGPAFQSPFHLLPPLTTDKCFPWALSLGCKASCVPNLPTSQIWEWFRLQLCPHSTPTFFQSHLFQVIGGPVYLPWLSPLVTT